MRRNKTSRLRVLLIALPLLAVAAAGAASTFVKTREGLKQQRATTAADWTAVDAALQERAGLIRDLANAAIESGQPVAPAAGQLSDAYAAFMRDPGPRARMQANDRLTVALARLLEAGDVHVRTKPSRRLARLEEQIKDSEERIAVARRKYNENLEHYNARIQRFPENLVARIAGFKRNDAYFRTEPF